MAPLTTIGRYVMPTDSHGNSSTELPHVVWTSFSPQTTMKIAITPINTSLSKSEARRNNGGSKSVPTVSSCGCADDGSGRADEGDTDSQQHRHRLGQDEALFRMYRV